MEITGKEKGKTPGDFKLKFLIRDLQILVEHFLMDIMKY